jgi:hypothetical protein
MGMEQTGFSVRSSYDTETGYVFLGFRIAFANGYAVSVQFGTANYCDAYGKTAGLAADLRAMQEGVCPNAEIAILAPNGDFVPFKNGNDVRGHTTPEILAEVLAWVAGLPHLTAPTLKETPNEA